MVEYLYFRCDDCKVRGILKYYDDPTTSSGACKNCGSKMWALYETSLTEKDLFTLALKGKSVKSIIQDKIEDRIA